jgi:hypothetical protein
MVTSYLLLILKAYRQNGPYQNIMLQLIELLRHLKLHINNMDTKDGTLGK